MGRRWKYNQRRRLKKSNKSFVGIIYSIAGCVVGSGAVESAGSAGNGDTTLPSAKARMIQSVGVHLL